MIFGAKTGSTGTGAFADGVVRMNRAVLPSGQHVVRVAALLNASAAANGQQRFRAVLASDAGAVLAVGPEVLVAAGSPAGWVSLPFDPAGLAVAEGACRFGVHGGPTGDLATYARQSAGADRYSYSVAYGALGASLGAPASTTTGPHLFILETLDGWVAPDVPDEQLARLPWDAAQRALAVSGPVRASRRSAVASWHGVDTDPERGAFCIARSDGALADLVGERVRVAFRVGTRERAVAVFCHDEQDFPDGLVEDISLSRRAFLALAPWAMETIPVTVEVLG